MNFGGVVCKGFFFSCFDVVEGNECDVILLSMWTRRDRWNGSKEKQILPLRWWTLRESYVKESFLFWHRLGKWRMQWHTFLPLRTRWTKWYEGKTNNSEDVMKFGRFIRTWDFISCLYFVEGNEEWNDLLFFRCSNERLKMKRYKESTNNSKDGMKFRKENALNYIKVA